MNACGEWDQWTARGYETIPVLIATMHGAACRARSETNPQGFVYLCARNHGHTGRHMAIESQGRYPVAVWR